jgi:hypothetical protein
MKREIKEAVRQAQSAVARLVSVLAKDGDLHAYREAKAAERAIDFVAGRFASLRESKDEL